MKCHRLLPGALALALSVSLCACGGAPDSPSAAPAQTLEELTAGQTITSETAELTLKGVVILDAVVDENISLDAKDDSDYLCAIYNIKNTGATEDDLIPETVLSNKVFYQGKYEYTEFDQDIAGNGNAYAGHTPLPPLRDFTLYCIVEIPPEASEHPEELVLTTTLAGTAYQTAEVQNAVIFQQEALEAVGEFTSGIHDFFNTINFTISFDTEPYREAYRAAQASYDQVKDALSQLTPPPYYQEGYDALMEVAAQWEEFLTPVCALLDASDQEFAQAMSDSGDNFDSEAFDQRIDLIQTSMPFLMDTDLRSL